MKKYEMAIRQEETAQFLLEKAHIVLREDEISQIEVINYGFSDDPYVGFQLITYVNTLRCCAKELVMFPHQTCLQHKHPPVDGNEGKEETFRCRYGVVYLYIEGSKTENPKAKILDGHEQYLTKAQHEIILKAGEQYTLLPNTWHWFQSGEEGCILSEFSTHSTDENDILSDPRIVRFPELEV